MQRLLSIKIISQTPRKLSWFCAEAIFSLPKRNPLPQFNPHRTIPYSFSHYYATCSNSWRSQLLPKSNAAALLKGQSKGLVNHPGLGFLKPRRIYHHSAGEDMWDNYTKWRIWMLWTLTWTRVFWAIIISNIAICVIRRSADPEFVNRNFTVSLENFRNLRLHTMITSGFNLADTGKPILYMIGLLVFGSNIGRTFGGEFLLSLYLTGAFVGSVFFLVGQTNLEKSAKKTQTVGIDHSKVSGSGASGAVNAVVLLDIFLFPKSRLYNLRVPAILLGVIIIGRDWWRIIKGDTKFSGAAHLGGALVATVSCLRIGGFTYFGRGLFAAVSRLRQRIMKGHSGY